MVSYTLGLDIGSNSIGWALLDTGKKTSIIDMGVRVFPEGVDRDTKGLEKSKNATRREARGARRGHQRRNSRRNQLVKTLLSAGILPKDKEELEQLLQKEPYKLRAKGLDHRLELCEFGRALFHINQRRGFKSNRKTGEVNEKSTIAKGDKEHRGANELQKAIDENNLRTIGEYFASINPEEQRIRGQYTFRSMYEKEFDLLWEKQSKYYPDILTEELKKKIKDEIIFYQRPLRPTEELIGECDLEPDEKRCPRGDWYARRFRILQDINNLIIQNPDGSELKLTDEQRGKLLSDLSVKKELKFNKVRKLLRLTENQKFNLEQEGKVKALKGDEFAWAMRSKNLFGAKRWDSMEEDERIELNSACLELEDDELIEKMINDYGFSEEQAEKALKITFPRGYMRFSRKAIQKLLPLMKQRKLTHEAVDAIYPDRGKKEDKEEKSKLGLPEDLRNPVVNKALFEVRKVANAIVREYGKPRKIKIEMARDVQGTKRQREEIQKKIWNNERANTEAREWIIENTSIKDPRRDDILKYKLWIECNKTCPYTGKTINEVDLFEEPVFQVEHILPYDRSLDDSFMNKTLCYVEENKIKGNQTPFEAYSHDTKRYEEILQRVNSSKMPYGKRRRFWQSELELDEHISRELNDTRYITKEVIRYLKQLGVSVQGTRGKVTGELRYQWGLDGIFTELGVERKNDHRRHTVDAVVVAVTKNEHLRSLAKSKYSVIGERFDPPWSVFREEVREKIKHINVSHRVQRKVSGKLHEETNYGATDKEGLYVFRKELKELTLPMVDKIVDPVVREIVKGRLTKKGIDLTGSGKPPKEVWSEPLYMKCKRVDKKVPIKKTRVYNVAESVIAMKDRSGQIYRYVEPGSNHHVEIWECIDGPNKDKRDAEVVTMFAAVRRCCAAEPVVKTDHGANTNFICSLSINDMVMMPNKKGEMDLYRVQKMSTAKQIYFRLHTAATIDDESTLIRKQANLFDGYKVTVDPIGRIWRSND